VFAAAPALGYWNFFFINTETEKIDLRRVSCCSIKESVLNRLMFE